MTQQVLVVCTGNVCRSPMASALLAAQAAKAGDSKLYNFSSAGTWALEGQPASANAQVVMQRRGLSLSAHRGRMVTRALVDESDLILVMTLNHRDSLCAEFPHARRKIHLLSELVGLQYDISDPYGSAVEEYEICAAGLVQLVEKGYPRLADLLAAAKG